ncbi:MAG TPA: dihydrodipicolinate synthase family protein [Dehalococcoidales bacterium]|nr:dihydrodipicolinate synthase family protein [Dehalococcoidales bacterium]
MGRLFPDVKKKLKGSVIVQLCPYTAHGNIDIEGLKENTRFILDFAKKGKDIVLLTNGSTGEFYANTVEEQKQVIKTTVETVAGRLPVIAGVSQASAGLTIQMARYAREVGADCALVVGPFYNHASKEGTYKYFQTIAGAVNIGIVAYNNPDVTGLLIPPDLMARLAGIDNIIACKDNSPTAASYFWKAATIDQDDMVLLNGLGEVEYIAAAAYGKKYRGFVNTIGNYAPELPSAVYEAVESGDFNKAMEALNRELPLLKVSSLISNRRESISVFPEWLRATTTYITIAKYAMILVGLTGGAYHSAELPVEELTAEEKLEVKRALREMKLI